MTPSERAKQGVVDWPDAYRDIQPAISARWGGGKQILLHQKLTSGKSGAIVFAVDVASSTFDGQAILKLDKAPDPAWQEEHEAERHRKAIEDAPEFAAEHLPRLIDTLHHGDEIAILSTVAARGLEYVEPWMAASFARQLSTVAELSRGLLEDWNRDYTLSDRIHMPHALLRRWLGYRLDPAAGGRIHEFLSADCGIEPMVPSVIFEGQWYPNPLAFTAGNSNLPERLGLRAISGRCHGDLHGLNVLLEKAPAAATRYYLIDLALYEDDQFLFYDQAYFEIAVLLKVRGEAGAADWEAILASLSLSQESQKDLRAEDAGMIDILLALRRELADWIERHEPDRMSFMESQQLLARVATGLNFVNKPLSLQSRQLAFIYAASNLKDYLRYGSVDWPKDGPILVLAPPGTRASGPSASGPEVPPSARPSAALPAFVDVSPAAPGGAVDEAARGDGPAPASEAPEPRARGRFLALWDELRRRSVVRVAAVYVAVAWLCLQMVQAIETALHLPGWTDTLVALLLITGFPIACIIAWAFELTPEGLRPARSWSSKRPHPPPGRSIIDYVAVAGLIVIAGISAGRLVGDLQEPTQTDVPASSARKTLAVLPFKNLNAGTESDDFSDGLTIEIMNRLARTGEFRMPGRTSSFKYKDRPADLREIGAALGVEFLLEGTVRKQGDFVRITAELIDADDGYPIWSDTIDEEMKDIFVAQERIADAISVALATPLDIDAQDLKEERTDDPEAYELFLEGIALFEKRGPALREAIKALERSVAIAPEFAAAWATLSLVYNMVPTYLDEVDGRPVNPSIWFRRAEQAALKAKSLDPDLPIVRNAVGNMYQRNRQWVAAEAEYEKGLLTDPANHLIMQDYATLLQIVGKQGRATEMVAAALEADPQNVLYETLRAFLRWQADQSEETIAALENLFTEYPEFRALIFRIVAGYRLMTGKPELARALVDSCSDCQGEWRDRALSMLNMATGDDPSSIFETYRDDVLLGYQSLYAVGGANLALEAFQYWAIDAKLRLQFFAVPWMLIEPLGSTEAFQEITEDMGLVDYWHERGWADHCHPVGSDAFSCG